ncbi:hypothetical protein [Geomicrobium sp. JCM 19055]|uniref:hypothetical protein n=1 Tax=Geomicrobium sp. JCM 19055 TaxID=1460649 RepID=UPI0006939E11|nr:hypothetical protein [Geomicrobium sp. JCM 19055]
MKTIRDLCPRCYQQEEDYFRRVSTFLRRRENRQSTIAETSDATGVSEQRILDYISQGRLQLIDLPNFECLVTFVKRKRNTASCVNHAKSKCQKTLLNIWKKAIINVNKRIMSETITMEGDHEYED